MKRRDLLNPLRLLRALPREGAAPAEAAREARDALFRLAMARGIDPANETPERLAELLGVGHDKFGETQRGR